MTNYHMKYMLNEATAIILILNNPIVKNLKIRRVI
jgi:hypothetical protein